MNTSVSECLRYYGIEAFMECIAANTAQSQIAELCIADAFADYGNYTKNILEQINYKWKSWGQPYDEFLLTLSKTVKTDLGRIIKVLKDCVPQIS